MMPQRSTRSPVVAGVASPSVAARLAMSVAMIATANSAMPVRVVAAAPATSAAVEGTAQPEDSDVRARAQRTAALIAEGALDEAAAAIEADIEAHPDPFVHLRGVLAERRGDCETASEAYRAYIALGVPREDAALAEAGLRRCRAKDEAGDDPDTREPATVEPRTVEPTPAVEQPRRSVRSDARRWWADPAALSFGVGGVAVLTTGAVVWSRAPSQYRQAGAAGSLSGYLGHEQRARRFEVAGAVLVSVGMVALIAAGVRFAMLARRARDRSLASRGRASGG